MVVLLLAWAVILWVRGQDEWPFQKRNLETAKVVIIMTILLLVWWTFFSRAASRLRLGVTFGVIGIVVLCATLFRIQGVSGDLVPIVEFRWAKKEAPVEGSQAKSQLPGVSTQVSFPQFYGPNRDGVLRAPRLDAKWSVNPPDILWRVNVGAAWSGFAVAEGLAITQEQRGETECVVAYDLASGKEIWRHSDPARYYTTIAGEGPRATPTVVSNRVFAFGATGILNCLELATGRRLWTRDVVKESGGKVLQWGCSSSPLVTDGLVVVHGGERAGRSLFAFRVTDGLPAWSGGNDDASYASPSLVTLADAPQILAFNDGSVSGHDPVSGVTLWQRRWGNGNVVCSAPVVVGPNRVLFSSGYGVGAELLEIERADSGKFAVSPVWKSIRMKAKFAHLFVRNGFLYGLDDGIFACVDLADGSQRWKEGRYGHGQGLLVADTYLLLAESGELVLLRPTSEAPHELARMRVFDSKTWNPPALAGDLLLVRNDQTAACLRMKLAP